MNVLFLSSGRLPHPTGNGVSVLTFGLISCLKNLGLNIIVVPVGLGYTNHKEEQSHKNYLVDNHVTVMEFTELKSLKRSKNIFDSLRKIVLPKESDYFYCSDSEREGLISFIQEKQIRIVLSFDWQALPIVHELKDVYLIASLVDPIGAVFKLRRKMLKQHSLKGLLFELMSLLRGRDMEKYALKYLKDYDLILEHAYHHAIELKNNGFNNVHYLAHPLPVPTLQAVLGGNSIPTSRDGIGTRYQKGLVTVLIAGSLKGVSSRLGFEFFLSQILPRLNKRKGQVRYQYKFRIVGHGKMIPSLKKRFEKIENVEFIGFVENIEDEYQKADIMLVTIPVKHGFRTRIAEAFSYGMCVVAHAANCEGMPEIKDGYNALTASDPNELTAKLIEAINNPELRVTFGANARETFINSLSIEAATKKMSKLLVDFLPTENILKE